MINLCFFLHLQGFYNCDICNLKYKNTCVLKKHRWRKHFEKPKVLSAEELTCKICGKKCKRKGALKTHELSHDNINKICPVCGITTSSNNFKVQLNMKLITVQTINKLINNL